MLHFHREGQVAVVKSRPCVPKDSAYSRQMHVEHTAPKNRNGFRLRFLHVYGSRRISIIVPHTGTKWGRLEKSLEEGAVD